MCSCPLSRLAPLAPGNYRRLAANTLPSVENALTG